MNKYLVLKTFAMDSEIYNAGDIVEMEAKDASELLNSNKLEKHVETKELTVSVDTKGITDAIAAGLAAFAPKPVVTETKGMEFGKFLQGVAKKTINITTSTQGQAAVTIFTDPMIDLDVLRPSAIANLVQRVVLTGTNNQYKFNIIDSSSAPAVLAESQALTATQPTIKTTTVSLEKFVQAYVATEEALADTGALVSEIGAAIPGNFALAFEDGIINGNATLVGIVDHAQTVEVAVLSSQTAGTIIADNIDDMYCAQENPGQSVWLMSRSAYCQVQKLEDTEGQRLMVGPNGLSTAPFGTLLGRPILVSDKMVSVGTVGDILFANLSKYKFVSKGALDVRRSDDILFLEGQSMFRFMQRVGGVPSGVKKTSADGTVIGHFVQLAERA